MEIMDAKALRLVISTLRRAPVIQPSGCPDAEYAWEAYDSQGNSVAINGNGTQKSGEWGEGPAAPCNC